MDAKTLVATAYAMPLRENGGKTGRRKTGTDHVFHVLQNRAHAEKGSLSPFSQSPFSHVFATTTGSETASRTPTASRSRTRPTMLTEQKHLRLSDVNYLVRSATTILAG